MKYLKFFKDINQYKEDKQAKPGDYSGETVSYVLSDLKVGEFVKYNDTVLTGTTRGLWIDDYQENRIYEDSGFDNWDDYFDYLLTEVGSDYAGANHYIYSGEMLELNGNNYYLWYLDEPHSETAYYALTSTINFDTLYNKSIEADYSNRECPFYAVLYDDKETVYEVTNFESIEYVILKAEKADD